MSKVMIVSILLITILTFTACRETGSDSATLDSESENITLIATHTASPDHPFQDGFEKMNEVLKEKSDGTMELEIHHSASLGEEAEVLEGLQVGTIDLTTVSVAPMTGFIKDYLVCDLPFLFQTLDEAYAFYDGEFGDLLFEMTEPVGFVGLAWWENGFRNFTNSKRPIQTPEDMEGLKLRTMNSIVHMAGVDAMGASATPIAYGELYSALQQKVVDGQENPIALIYDNRFYETQKYLTLSKHFYDPSPTYMSKKNMDKLSEEQQQWLKEAAIEGGTYMRNMLNDSQVEQIAFLKEKGMEVTEFTDEQYLAFKEATKDVYKDFEDEVDPEVMAKFKKLVRLQ